MRLPRLLSAVALLAALAGPAAADDTKDFLDPANWEGRDDLRKIVDGAVVGETKEDPKYNTFFCSKKKYGDFDLTYKVQLRDGVGNSGVQIRSAVVDAKKFVVAGPQVDVGKGFIGALYGEKVGGYLLKPKKDLGKLAEFNEFHVVAKGNRVTITVNGEASIDADFPGNNGKNPTPAEGIIAFQIHGGYAKMRVEFKDIVFKDLSKK